MPSASHQHADSDQAGENRAGIRTVEHLVEHLREYVSDSMAIVCVGNELRGDDGAALAVANSLAGTVPWNLYDTQGVPESFLMKIAANKPDPVILVDALDFGAEPGAIELIESNALAGQGPSTHGPAPLAFLEILEMFHPCRDVVLGIQPKATEFGSQISRPVADAIDRIIRAFRILAKETSAGGQKTHSTPGPSEADSR